MNAADLVPIQTNSDIRFGLGRPEVLVADLRALADAVEQGRVILRRIETREEAEQEEFPTSAMTLVFHEFKRPAEG